MHKVLIAAFIIISFQVRSQTPVFSSYPLNPTLYNPAFTGIRGISEVSFNQRHQWLGIEEAPMVSTFQFHTSPVQKVGVGIQAQRFTQGIIHTNQANLMFSYKVPFGRLTSLHFGISGGFRRMGINADQVQNLNDPALGGLLAGHQEADVQFGVNYKIGRLNLGMVFHEMIPRTAFLNNFSDPSDIKFYENYIAHIDYLFSFSATELSLQPFLLYRRNFSQLSYVEGGGLLHWKDVFYAGAAYRQHYGLSILTGFQVSKFRFGYAYELATEQVNSLGYGSHEIQLTFRFGKAKSPKEKTKKKQEPPQTTKEIQKAKPTAEPAKADEPLPAVEETRPEVESDQEKELNMAKELEELPVPQHAVYHYGNHPQELPIGFYIITGAFNNYMNAKKHADQVSKAGSFTGIGYNSERKVYFVFVYRASDLEKTREMRAQFRQKPLLKDAWLLEIREK
ncbi:MAG: PorP/SprF family type IX secretion system membrane protein [Cyclobacteriaceae bacterium]